MIYINEPKQPYVRYYDAVELVIKHGVERQRAYLYLAAHGIKSADAKIMSADLTEYFGPVKIAMKGDKYAITDLYFCEHGGLIIK